MANKKNVLTGMANAGIRLGNAPLLINNNGVKSMTGRYSGVTSSSCSKNVLPPLAELKQAWQQKRSVTK